MDNVQGDSSGSGASEEQPFPCDLCDKRYKWKKNLRFHQRNKHFNSVRRRHKCPECDKSFQTPSLLVIHRRKHTGERPFLCELCAQSFSKAVNLQQHKNAVHHKLKPFKCPQCSNAFSTKQTLETHLLTHQKKLRPHQCIFCRNYFRTRSQLLDHIRRHTREKPYSCPEERCQQPFASKHDLKVHLERHNSKLAIICPLCRAPFRQRYQLHFHLKVDHKLTDFGRGVRHICIFCQKEFYRKGELEAHIRRKIKEKPFLCRRCGKTFVSQSEVSQHAQAAHRIGNEKEFQCEICQKLFATAHYLCNHVLRVHRKVEEKMDEEGN